MALIVAADAAIPADWDVSGLDVKVFTKVASPFSERGDDCTGAPELEEPCKALGFSHEFLDKLLTVAFPGKLLTKTTIFCTFLSRRRTTTASSSTFSLGSA